MDKPLLVFAISVVALSTAAWFGAFIVRRQRPIQDEDDYSVILAATLTLLGLFIGFSFSMAVSRYDLRKNYEEAEANAIGTDYVRADFLPLAEAAQLRQLLRAYLDRRVMFYKSDNPQLLRQISEQTAQLQSDLWALVRNAGLAQPNPVIALTVAGMNDVLNSESYTQAAWRNRIPVMVWVLMGAIAICGNVLIGLGAHANKSRGWLLVILPLTTSISFALIADIDSPRGGLIRLAPQNLVPLVASLRL